MSNRFGVFGDPQFWKDMGNNASGMVSNLRSYGDLPAQASDIAEHHFPGSARDGSTKNAFRHALGTGMLAQRLGGGMIGAGVAKAVGYGWEGLGMLDGANRNNPKFRDDSLHDLNANAIGAATARKTNNQEELVQALKRLALESVPAQPPGAFAPSPGYMTRSAQ